MYEFALNIYCEFPVRRNFSHVACVQIKETFISTELKSSLPSTLAKYVARYSYPETDHVQRPRQHTFEFHFPNKSYIKNDMNN